MAILSFLVGGLSACGLPHVLAALNWTPRVAAVTTATAFVCSRHIPIHLARLLSRQAASDFPEPADAEFGRRDYWNSVYSTQETFSWYTGWNDLEPFVRELVPIKTSHVLIPGIGNDVSVRDMYDVGGYRNLTAFDYAEAGVRCAGTLLGAERLRDRHDSESQGVTLLVADARDLPFKDSSFDSVLEKGTLDAIYLSGGTNKTLARQHLGMAVSELARVIVKGGVVISVSAACANQVRTAFQPAEWDELHDGSTYITEDGFASNNIDGTLLAWKRTFSSLK